MPQVQPTTTITIDDATFEVASMSDDVKQLVVYLDEWRQDEADQISALLKTRAARHDVQNTLLQTIQQEAQEAQEAAPEVQPEVAAPAPKAKAKRVK